MGHSEPAAGLVGLLTLAAELTHAAAPALLHLTSLNPYVASVLNATGGGGGGAGHGLVSMSRQTRGGPVGARGVVHGGVSSFAFQGTNTHAVLSAHPGGPAHPTDVSGGLAGVMHQHCLWVLPKPHSLLTLAQTDPSTVTMHCQLSDPCLAFLLDHRVMGRALFPAAGMLEAAAAAAKTLLGDQSPNHTWACTVSGMTIAAPLQLASASAAILLQTSMDLATGSVQIRSTSAATAQLLHNARCTVSMACKAQGAVPLPAAVAGGALGQLMAGWGAAMQGGERGPRGRRAGPRYHQPTLCVPAGALVHCGYHLLYNYFMVAIAITIISTVAISTKYCRHNHCHCHCQCQCHCQDCCSIPFILCKTKTLLYYRTGIGAGAGAAANALEAATAASDAIGQVSRPCTSWTGSQHKATSSV